jgi:DNA repair protein RadA/Sms
MNQEITKRRGRPKKDAQNITYVPSVIDFSAITKLNKLDIDPKMMESMTSGLSIDKFISHEGGVPAASNIIIAGAPGVGKTTVLLDLMSGIVKSGKKCLFISGEMGHKQMYKYHKRFPQFGNIETLFMSDYLQYNTKDVIEQALNIGYDLVLIDSAAEIIGSVRDDNGWDRKMAESWLVEICLRNNKGENKTNKYTSFLLIQQMTKSEDMVGSNKLKHLMDAALYLRRESERNGGGTYMQFEKNRNGEVGQRMSYQLTSNSIYYGAVSEVDSDEPDELELEITNPEYNDDFKTWNEAPYGDNE